MSEDKKDMLDEKTEGAINACAPSETQAIENNTEVTEQKPVVPPHKEYANRMQNFSKFYLGFLLIVASIMMIAVVVAVLYNVLIGVSLAILGAVFYSTLIGDNMSKTLGFKYVSIPGGIKLTACRARYGEVMWVPQRLMWFDVIEIGDRAFCTKRNAELKKVFLPLTLRRIGKDIFDGCPLLETIYYEGSKEDFEKIESDTDVSGYSVIFDAKYPPVAKKKKKKSAVSASKK